MHCPKCGHPIEQDFGVFPCAKCHAVLFVDMEGQVQISEEGSESTPAEVPPAMPPPPLAEASISPPTEVDEIRPRETVNLAEEMSAFANAATQSGKFTYDLLIEGIDSSEVRDRLYDALADRRFKWDARALIQSIHSGRLQLIRLNSAKAAVLVHRLSELPVRIQWIQKFLDS